MSTASKKRRILDEIYQSLPSIQCKGLCYNACGAVPVYPAELVRLEAAAKRSLPMFGTDLPGSAKALVTSPINLQCPLLVLKRCSAYDDRPFICRLYGLVEQMRCPHGCTPTRMVTNQEVITIQRKLEKL